MPAAQERIGSPADYFGLGKPPADAFGVALRAARQSALRSAKSDASFVSRTFGGALGSSAFEGVALGMRLWLCTNSRS